MEVSINRKYIIMGKQLIINQLNNISIMTPHKLSIIFIIIFKI